VFDFPAPYLIGTHTTEMPQLKIGHFLPRNCFLKHPLERKIEPRIEVMVRRRRRGKQQLDELKEEYIGY
jgi:hypothetical protein